MAFQAQVSTTRDSGNLQERLRAAVMQELVGRQLDAPEALAERLGVLPIAAENLLGRSVWSVETSLWVVERLDLPVEVSITVHA